MAQCPYGEYVITETERNSAGWGISKSTQTKRFSYDMGYHFKGNLQ